MVKNSYKKIFLIDSFGALSSAILLGLVLTRYEAFFGMPSKVLHTLSVIPCVFALYSFLCFLIETKNRRLYLSIIAIANLLYCCLTTSYIISFYEKLTIWGLIYFVGEIIVVVILAFYEWEIAKKR